MSTSNDQQKYTASRSQQKYTATKDQQTYTLTRGDTSTIGTPYDWTDSDPFYILLETGDYLLLETGDRFRLEG